MWDVTIGYGQAFLYLAVACGALKRPFICKGGIVTRLNRPWVRWFRERKFIGRIGDMLPPTSTGYARSDADPAGCEYPGAG
jgi:hypothetical protein